MSAAGNVIQLPRPDVSARLQRLRPIEQAWIYTCQQPPASPGALDSEPDRVRAAVLAAMDRCQATRGISSNQMLVMWMHGSRGFPPHPELAPQVTAWNAAMDALEAELLRSGFLTATPATAISEARNGEAR